MQQAPFKVYSGECSCCKRLDSAADYLTNLPLILLPLLLGLELHHANLVLQPKAPKWLGEDVRELSAGLDKLEDDLSSIDAIPKEMKLDVDVLALVVKDIVLGEGNGGLIVHHQSWQTSFLDGPLAQQPAQLDRLARRYGRRDVLHFARRQRHHLLLQWLPRNQG